MPTRLLDRKVTRRQVLAFGSGVLGAIVLPPSTAKAASFTMKGGSLVSNKHPNTMGLIEFSKRVKERTNGDIDVQVFPSAQLGGEKDVFEGMRLGSVQLGVINVSVAGAWVPEGQLFDLPFIFRDPDHSYRVCMGEVGNTIAALYPKQGVQVLGFWIMGVRHPMAKKPLLVPDDCKGLKMRVIQSAIHIDTWKLIGANPTPIPHAEVVSALQQGVVDYIDNSLATYYDAKFYEQVKHVMLLGHIYAIGAFCVSKRFWDRLPQDHQEVLRKAAHEVIPMQNKWMGEADDMAITETTKLGSFFHKVDQRPWREKVRPIWEQWAPKVGGMALIEKAVNTN